MDEGFILHFLQSDHDVLFDEDIVAGISNKKCNLNLSHYLKGRIGTISRAHFRIFSDGEDLFIEDLKSMNGTELNQKPLQAKQARKLSHEDRIRLAQNDEFIIIFRKGGTQVIDGPHYIIREKGVDFHQDEGNFYVDGKAIHGLSEIPFNLLIYLYKHENIDCSYFDIIDAVWYGNASKVSVRTTIGKLRRSLDKASKGAGKRYIKAITGYGYKLIVP